MRPIPPHLSRQLEQLERSLLEPSIRSSAQHLRTLLSEDFREIGASGQVFNREDIIRELAGETSTNRITMDDFLVTILTIDVDGNEVAMTSYVATCTTAQSKLIRRARRTSIWLCCDGRWRMHFHQGTMLEQPA